MNLSNCISCNVSQCISIKYTAAFTKVSWKRYDAVSNMLSLLNEIVIWPIPLCEDCSKIAYQKKLKRDIWRYFIIFLSGVFTCFGAFAISADMKDRPILKLLLLGFCIISAFVGIITPFFILGNKIKLVKFSKTKSIPKKDEEIAFIGMAEEILKSSNKKYRKPKFLELDKMPLDEGTRQEIIKWRKSIGKFKEERETSVYQYAASSKEEVVNYLKRIGDIDKLPFPDEWIKDISTNLDNILEIKDSDEKKPSNDYCPEGCGKLNYVDGKLLCEKCGWWIYN